MNEEHSERTQKVRAYVCEREKKRRRIERKKKEGDNTVIGV
jgi:hypothetical protein